MARPMTKETLDEIRSWIERLERSAVPKRDVDRILEGGSLHRLQACVAEIERAQAILNPLEWLRQHEGWVVHVFCDNPEFITSSADAAVEVSAFDLNWTNRRFEADTFAAALALAQQAALEAEDERDRAYRIGDESDQS